MTALVCELPDDTLPDGWVWADRTALRATYAVPNAFQSFSARVTDRLGHF
jgi:A/G-specific adenine glycosylase